VSFLICHVLQYSFLRYVVSPLSSLLSPLSSLLSPLSSLLSLLSPHTHHHSPLPKLLHLSPTSSSLLTITHTHTHIHTYTYTYIQYYIDLRQFSQYKIKERPKDVVPLVEHDSFVKSQDYQYARGLFSLVTDVISTSVTLAVLWYGGLPYWWNLSRNVTQQYLIPSEDTPEQHEYIVSVVFTITSTLLSTVFNLPFSLFSTFVIEEKFGMNKYTLGLYFTDVIKSLLINSILMALLLPAVLALFAWSGNMSFIYVTAFLLVFQLVMLVIYPHVIEPCFNKVEKLPQGELRSAIEKLASSLDFPLTEIYTIDGSRRSNHSNAYFYGLWKQKRIVIFDTLIEQSQDPAHIVAVVAHELGHWKRSHTLKLVCVALGRTALILWMFNQVATNKAMFASFGFVQFQPFLIGLLIFFLLISPLSHVMSFLSNALTRKFEYEADAFGAHLGYAKELRQGLITLCKENKSSFCHDWLYSTLHHSHPTLIERLRVLKAISSKSD
jgi:STE24 endopeptidase